VPAPRLYFLVASAAPVAAVFRRGPSGWWNVGRWDLVSGEVETGAWFHGTMYPSRGDLSPDGTLLLSYLLKRRRAGFLDASPPPWPDTYVTVSMLPWLHALAAWREGTTWGRGYCFAARRGRKTPFVLGEPAAGDATPLRRRYGVQAHTVIQYAAERRRGWEERAESPPRRAGGPWDEQRSAVLWKPQPRRGGGRLILRDGGKSARRGIEGRVRAYGLEARRGPSELPGVVCADWSPSGDLLVATDRGTLEVRDPKSLEARRVVDLSGQAPAPQAAPDWARHW